VWQFERVPFFVFKQVAAFGSRDTAQITRWKFAVFDVVIGNRNAFKRHGLEDVERW
jgi:hypothetical protein